MKDKLIELIIDGFRNCTKPHEVCSQLDLEALADHLIANGVTVQRWIPVTERLPEDSATVLVCHKNGFVTTNAWLDVHWWFKNERNPITHWMPPPEAPKEVE